VLFEEKLIYYPARFPEGDWTSPAAASFPLEDVFFPAADGTPLHGWLAGAESAPHTLLYFHGNAGNLTHRYQWIARLVALPARVFAIDYRGYGKSEGRPSEAGLYADAGGAWRHLVEERGAAPASIILYGKSLGGAPACRLAERHSCRALFLQSTFTSAREVARVIWPVLPLAPFVRTRFDNAARVAHARAPVLILHSRHDEMLPFAMARRLHEAAPAPKRLAVFEDATHNDLVAVHGEGVLEAMREFLAETRC
jgi:fermentation-respiration switch protein FrsA (DUF1100 family)